MSARMAVVNRWVMMSAVWPLTISRKRPSHSVSVHESIALVGSSSTTSGALRKNERASATRCHCPPLSSEPPTNHRPRGVS